jgi:hypothetical protein
MGEVTLLILILLLEIIGPVLYVVALIWAVVSARRVYREVKSLKASKGDEIAMSMEKNRLKSLILKIIAVLIFPVVLLATILIGLPVWLSVNVTILFSVVILGWSAFIKSRYVKDFKGHLVQTELAKVFDNLNYNPNGSLDHGLIRGLDFFFANDLIKGNDLISADYKGLHFEQCDLNVNEEYTVTTQNSNGELQSETRYRSIFQGRAMRFDFSENFHGRVQVVSRDFDGAKVKSVNGDWSSVETELVEFNNRFNVFAIDPLDAMATLTPQMIEGIFFLNQALGVPMALYFSEKTMNAFFDTGREAFDVSGNKTLLEERALLQKDVAFVTGFLDTMYFKPQENYDSANRMSAEERLAAAQATSEALAPSQAQAISKKVTRSVGKTVGLIRTYMPYAIIASFILSAVYAFIQLPDGIVAGTSDDAMVVPTIGYLVVAGVFIVLPALARAFFFSIIALVFHFI